MHPHLVAVASAQGGVFTHAQALASGYTPRQVKHRVARGSWVRLRRGVLADAQTHAAAAGDPVQAHLLRASAVVATIGRAAWLSHHSAALAWGIPLIGGIPRNAAVTIEHQHRRPADGVELHTAVTPPQHRGLVDGRPVTSAARTVSDLARSRPFAHAVVAADAALYQRLCTLSDVHAVVADCPVWPGIARTKRVLDFVDQRAESPGESLSRVAIAAAGLPAPDLQVELLLGGRHFRVDFMWPALRLVGEFDGRVKYRSADDVWNEKLREDLVRRHDYRVARWTWADVYPRPDGLLRVLDRYW